MRTKRETAAYRCFTAAIGVTLLCVSYPGLSRSARAQPMPPQEPQAPAKPPKAAKPVKPQKPASAPSAVEVIRGPNNVVRMKMKSRKRGFLGVRLIELTSELRQHFGVAKNVGILVAEVEKGSPAQRAGIKVGDVLVALDGKQVQSNWQAVRHIAKKQSGDKTLLKVFRKKKAMLFTAIIKERMKPQIEVGRFIHRIPGERDAFEIEVDTEAIEDAVEELTEQLEGLEGLEGLEELEELESSADFKRYLRQEKRMQEKLKRMEEKLQKMEQKLEDMETE